jgi:hypothetical protein
MQIEAFMELSDFGSILRNIPHKQVLISRNTKSQV